jgi:hypothetical protein
LCAGLAATVRARIADGARVVIVARERVVNVNHADRWVACVVGAWVTVIRVYWASDACAICAGVHCGAEIIVIARVGIERENTAEGRVTSLVGTGVGVSTAV